MTEKIRLSFSTEEGEGRPVSTLYNPKILSFAARSQAARFGLIADKDAHLSGLLKGNRKNLIEMIKTYGYDVEVVQHTLSI